MTVDLDRLERLAAEATPGPWERSLLGILRFDSMRNCFVNTADAEFIAASDPETVQQLVRAVRAALVYLDADDQDPHLVEFFSWVSALEPFRGPVAAAEDAG